MRLEAGAAREIITPEIGGKLFGYRPDVISVSVHDDLTVSAAVFRCGTITLVLISATVCLISGELADEIRNGVGAALGVNPSHVIVSATHTHSGPNTVGWTGWGELDRPYCDGILKPRCVQAAKRALAALKPVKAGFGEVLSGVGINRRQIVRDGSVILGQNPWGIYDPRMTVLAFADAEGPFLNIVHYSAHCTAAGMNHEITRDWAGVMMDRLETESGALTMFINGTEGDVGPRISNGGSIGDLGLAMELGGLAGMDAVRAWRGIREYRETDLGVTEGVINIPCAPLWPLPVVQEQLSAYQDRAPPEINLEGAKYRTLKDIETLYTQGKTGPETFIQPQTMFRIGPVVFIPFVFELFTEIALRLRAYSPFQYTLSMSNTNGAVGYLPTEADMCRGGYEVEMFHWRNVRRLPDDTDTRIINENLRIMEGL
jgi:hypothetical protein